MKLSQIEKRIPQTFTNSKDVIQKAENMLAEKPDQINARPRKWGLGTVEKNPSQVSWVDPSRDRYIALPKLATTAGNTFARGL